MNARQRRKAYRAMPKPGTRVQWTLKSGRVNSGVAVGPMPIHRDQFNEERRNVPNVLSVRVRLEGGAHAHPLASRLRAVA
jgi:hypothetical protein